MKMSDFEMLKALQKELVYILNQRKNIKGWMPRACCKAKINRLRLQLQEIMLRIERKCGGCEYKDRQEKWE